MIKNATRALGAVAGIATLAAVGLSASSASAAAGDPVTGGTATLTVPSATILSGAAAGVVAIPTSPATGSYDQTNNNAVYTFPVSGGDGSVSAFYGSVNYAGGLYVADYKTHKSVTLGSLSLSITGDTVSATPVGSSTAFTLLDINGSHTTSNVSGTQTFSGTDVQLDAAGATYLDHALNTNVFAAGQHLGSFSTTFTNTQY